MLAVPVVILLAALIGIATFDWDSPRTDVLPLLAVGVLLVGFSEELLTRGLIVVGMRGALKEPMVWFVTSLLFGLMHGLNIIFGQAVGATLQQIVFAFVLGTAFYVTRRVTGRCWSAWPCTPSGTSARSATTPPTARTTRACS